MPLPELQGRVLPCGSVQLSDAGSLRKPIRFAHWRSNRPGRSTRFITINGIRYKLHWPK